ncbi:major pollen allergen Art v 1-like isoform X1 [Olea europaea var. sylvestris]|uniref:major pollen allergen Art v 1-like isoform X1 n=1 Tax=Olea europaea var. sylvestris TaxID=158386 RepID=UPI000C1D242D|nr:major pollen allergen Art v 1-like isoform X1 [Olea europaea var. sylvestris]
MAKLNKTTFLALFFCFLIIAAYEMQTGEAKPCTKLSKGWRGLCAPKKCSSYCIHHEGAYHGACLKNHHNKHYGCYCYYRHC